MSQSRKSPVHPMAAMLGDVHPSPAIWVRFVKNRRGEIEISNIGRFMTGFHSDNNHCFEELRAEFRATYAHPYFGQEHWMYTPGELGLTPSASFQWYQRYHGEPPTDEFLDFHFQRAVVRDPRDPLAVWGDGFIVKFQHAHRVFGCTPDEFRRVHLAKFYEEIAYAADYLWWTEEEDARRAAEAELVNDCPVL